MISVVVPAFNEEDVLPHCLQSLIQQTFPLDQLEVIVVDNHSTDATASQAKGYADRLPLRVISQEIKGRGPARMAGFAAAQGEIILSTDADTLLPPTWIEQMIAPILAHQAVATTTSCKIDDCSWLTNTLFNLIQPLGMKLYRLKYGHYWLTGASFAISQTVYQQSGGFDSNLNAQEDTLLSLKVSRLGKIKYLNPPVVTSSGRRFKGGLIKGLAEYITSFNQAYSNQKQTAHLSDVR